VEKAKEAADKGDYDDEQYWAVVAHIYENMGGSVQEQTATNNQETVMNKEQKVAWLVTNCDCYKGAEKTLNGMEESQLDKLKTNAEKQQRTENAPRRCN